MSLLSKLGLLRDVIRIHTNWVLFSLFGREVLSNADYDELKNYKKLNLHEHVSFIEKSYLLGRFKSFLRSSEYKKISETELSDELKRSKFTPLEKLVIQQAQLTAAENVKGLMDDISKGVYDVLSEAIGDAVSEATVKQIIKEEVVSSLARGEGYKELAQKLATNLQDKYSRDWERVAQTELHSAKTKGFAQAIINKIGVYSGSAGVDSRVSIVPNAKACGDCRAHYLDGRGNPKIFKLRELLSKGTNADPAVSHARGSNGLHAHWKTTLPPLHPRCFCQLVYIPDGFGWANGKLVVADDKQYTVGVARMKKAFAGSDLAKAGGIGDPRKTGQTDAATKAQKEPSAPGNIPGVQAPQAASAGGGLPAPPGGSSDNFGCREGYVPCMYGGKSGNCETYGGESGGADCHEAGGAIQAAHMKFFATDAAARDVVDSAKLSYVSDLAKDASKAWYDEGVRTESDVNAFLSDNEFAAAQAVVERPVDKTTAFGTTQLELAEDAPLRRPDSPVLVSFKDGGQGVVRAPLQHQWSDYDRALAPDANGSIDSFWLDGLRTTPHDAVAQHEVAAYSLSRMLGFGLVPVTVSRNVVSGKRQDGISTSIQNFEKDFRSLDVFGLDDDSATVKKEIFAKIKLGSKEGASAAEKSFSDKYMNAAVFTTITGDADGNSGSILFNEDLTDVRTVDFAFAFSNGLDGCKNALLTALSKQGIPLRIPEATQTRLEGVSLGQLQSAMGGTLQDWQIGQTYLRIKYALYLQRRDGELAEDKFVYLHPKSSSDENAFLEDPKVVGRFDRWSALHGSADTSRRQHAENELTPNKLFEAFSSQWIQDNKEDDQSLDQGDAQALSDMGVFMSREAFYRKSDDESGFSTDYKAFRDEGKHKDYERDVVSQRKYKDRLIPRDVGRENQLRSTAPEKREGLVTSYLDQVEDHMSAGVAARGEVQESLQKLFTKIGLGTEADLGHYVFRDWHAGFAERSPSSKKTKAK